MGAWGFFSTSCSLTLHVMGWILSQLLPSGQHTAVVPPARALHDDPSGQQKVSGSTAGQLTRSLAEHDESPSLAKIRLAGMAVVVVEHSAVSIRRRRGIGMWREMAIFFRG